MAIQFVSALAESTASPGPSNTFAMSAMPSHQSGDLLLFFAGCAGYSKVPDLPANTIQVFQGQITSTAFVCGFRIANSSSETSGTFGAGTTQIGCAVYRSSASGCIVLPGHDVQGSSTSVGAGGNILYNALSDRSQGIDKWFAGLVVHRSTDTDIESPPTGMTHRAGSAGALLGEIAMHDSNGTLSSWPATNYTLTTGTAGAYRSAVLELVELAIPSGGQTIIVIED